MLRALIVDDDDQAFGALFEIPSDKLSAYMSGQEIQQNFHPALGFVNRM